MFGILQIDITVKVFVTDYNDRAPEFSQPDYYVNVPEVRDVETSKVVMNTLILYVHVALTAHSDYEIIINYNKC